MYIVLKGHTVGLKMLLVIQTILLVQFPRKPQISQNRGNIRQKCGQACNDMDPEGH